MDSISPAAAQGNLARTNRDDNGTHTFCSEDALEREAGETAEYILYVASIENAILSGRDAIVAGNCVEGIDAARKAAAQRRAERS